MLLHLQTPRWKSSPTVPPAPVPSLQTPDLASYKSSEKVFDATVNGHETYRYHEGLEKVRSWICLPLTMDIFDRSKGTIDALFSPDLWTKDGLLTEAGGKTFWDRSTL